MLWNRFEYSTTTQNKGDRQMEFKFTIQLDRKNPKYEHGYIKFLNDSTFLLRINSWDIPKDADTSNKKVSVFVKIKHPSAGTEPRLPAYKDLAGKWLVYSSKANITSGFIFIDTSRVIHIYKSDEHVLNYKIDFTKQPITFDLDIKDKIWHCYLGFYNNDILRIEMFKPDKERPDHFTVFGHNVVLRRQKDKAAAEAN